MVKYLNSPLKITGSLLVAAGLSIATISMGQFLFLGMSVVSLGVLVHVTNWIICRSHMNTREKKIFEFCLLLFIISLCATFVLDYFGIIRLSR